MNMDVLLNNLATGPATIAGLAASACALLYGFGSPWWRSLLGIVFFGLFVATVPVFGVVVVSRITSAIANGGNTATTGDGGGLMRFAIYTFSALVWIALFIAIIIERRSSDVVRIPIRKD